MGGDIILGYDTANAVDECTSLCSGSSAAPILNASFCSSLFPTIGAKSNPEEKLMRQYFLSCLDKVRCFQLFMTQPLSVYGHKEVVVVPSLTCM